jgi:transposase
MITQSSLRPNALLRKFVLGAHPIIEHYLQKLRIGELIATYIPQDQRIKLPIERTLSLLIHNILTTPMPMYAIADWLAPLDEHCLGLEPAQAACIHDDRVGQALERFYHGRHKDVFFHLALRAIKTFGLQCEQIHQDTTTVTFSGKYADWQAPEDLTQGHNKDHRPDLKQLVLGLSVTADGSVPLVHQIFPGNQTDDRVHPENHQRLRRLLQRTDFIYVADCKLATQENLHRLAGCGGRFVSGSGKTKSNGFTSSPGKTTANPIPKSTATTWPRANTRPVATDCCGFAAPRKPSRMPNGEPSTSPRAWKPSENFSLD